MSGDKKVEISIPRQYGKVNEANRMLGHSIREACKPGMDPFTVILVTQKGNYRVVVFEDPPPKGGAVRHETLKGGA